LQSALIVRRGNLTGLPANLLHVACVSSAPRFHFDRGTAWVWGAFAAACLGLLGLLQLMRRNIGA